VRTSGFSTSSSCSRVTEARRGRGGDHPAIRTTFAAARVTDGMVVARVGNGKRQLGDGASEGHRRPVLVRNFCGATAIAAAGTQGAALVQFF
jgi:hypothetical protein